jgi:hypothetical protein
VRRGKSQFSYQVSLVGWSGSSVVWLSWLGLFDDLTLSCIRKRHRFLVKDLTCELIRRRGLDNEEWEAKLQGIYTLGRPAEQQSAQELDTAVALMMAIGPPMSEDESDRNLDGFPPTSSRYAGLPQPDRARPRNCRSAHPRRRSRP